MKTACVKLALQYLLQVSRMLMHDQKFCFNKALFIVELIQF